MPNPHKCGKRREGSLQIRLIVWTNTPVRGGSIPPPFFALFSLSYANCCGEGGGRTGKVELRLRMVVIIM